jgi:hypothetical protein
MKLSMAICCTLLLGCNGGDWVGHIALRDGEIETKTFTGPRAREYCEAWQLILVEKHVYGEDPYEGPRLWVVFSPEPGAPSETHTIGPTELQTVRELFGASVRAATAAERETYESEIAQNLKAYRGWCSRR